MSPNVTLFYVSLPYYKVSHVMTFAKCLCVFYVGVTEIHVGICPNSAYVRHIVQVDILSPFPYFPKYVYTYMCYV